MPRRLMDDLKGEVIDEKVHKSTLGYDILSAGLNSEDALLLNIREDCVFGVTYNLGGLENRLGTRPQGFESLCLRQSLGALCFKAFFVYSSPIFEAQRE